MRSVFIALVLFLFGVGAARSQSHSDALLVVDAAGKQFIDIRQSSGQAIELSGEVLELAELLKAEIDSGFNSEAGPNAPKTLAKFSVEVLKQIPDLFERRSVIVVTDNLIPIELVQRDGKFLGDMIPISHEYPVAKKIQRSDSRYPMMGYAIEAIIDMPTHMPRSEQDIVKVALNLEREIAVQLSFGGGAGRIREMLGRKDISVLHLDTHGGPQGREVQVDRYGTMLESDTIREPVSIPIVLLFGCEGTASKNSFGSVLRVQGAEAVISSFAKFTSFGLTGDPSLEHRIYEAFFSALRSGQTVGAALLALRRAAVFSRQNQSAASAGSLTRLLFVLVGRDEISFEWPSAKQR